MYQKKLLCLTKSCTGGDMKYVILALLLISLLIGCSIRFKGKPYSGYSCRESIRHFYKTCSAKEFTTEALDAKIRFCEKELATNICDKEQADLLWCMGRVAQGKYTQLYGAYGSSSSIMDGCDCSVHISKLRTCRTKKGIIDDYSF